MVENPVMVYASWGLYPGSKRFTYAASGAQAYFSSSCLNDNRGLSFKTFLIHSS